MRAADSPLPRDEAPVPTAPATGAMDPYWTEVSDEEEPVTVGTLFLTMIILMIIAAVWVVVYLQLIDR